MVAMAGVGDIPWYIYVVLPFISAILGWLINALALEMTFGPVEFLGIDIYRFDEQPCGLFGWQGIIPSKAKKKYVLI